MGLSVVLMLVGVKMIGSHYVNVPTEWALGIVLAVLAGSIAASLAWPPRRRDPEGFDCCRQSH